MTKQNNSKICYSLCCQTTVHKKHCYCSIFSEESCICRKKITIYLFEWRSALGMRRVALASAESNAAPSEAKPAAARPAGKRPKNQCVIIRLFNQNGTLLNFTSLLYASTILMQYVTPKINTICPKPSEMSYFRRFFSVLIFHKVVKSHLLLYFCGKNSHLPKK